MALYEMWTIILLLACSILFVDGQITLDEARSAIIQAEESIMSGGTILLTENEERVNKILLKARAEEVERGLKDSETYAPGMHFFKAKKLIEQSKVFKFIKKMPKGAVLHGHNTALVSSEWMVKNLTYRTGALRCMSDGGYMIFAFRKQNWHRCSTYIDIVQERSKSPNIEAYDKDLEKHFNIFTPNPETEFPHIYTVWSTFQNLFATNSDLIHYLPSFRDYHWQLMEEMYEDGIMYMELRVGLQNIYDDDNEYAKDKCIQVLKEIIEAFSATHPGFIGAKLILTTARQTSPEVLQGRIKEFNEFYEKYPNFVIGFDLVGQEDLGQPLKKFAAELAKLPSGVQLFFHAGETNWYGGEADLNLLDAILLNTTRIGHGYALLKHPVLWNAVKTKGIGVEISPISNQVLHLVWDLRNHPAAFFVSENVPIIICNDDPGFWKAKGMSYDFYYGYMAFTPNDAGLSVLKQFVWNSIKYSALKIDELKPAYAALQKQWEQFLDDVLKGKVI